MKHTDKEIASHSDAKTGLFHDLLLQVLRQCFDQSSHLWVLQELHQRFGIRVVRCRILILFPLAGVKRLLEQLGILHSLKDLDRLADAIPGFKIDMQFFGHLRSQATEEKIAIINASIDRLITEVGRLQGAISRQKKEIAQTVERYNKEINSFLLNAGYSYIVSIDEMPDHTYKLLLKFGENPYCAPPALYAIMNREIICLVKAKQGEWKL